MKTKRKRIYLTNDFHNTSTFILCDVTLHSKTLRLVYEASARQVYEARKRLCGMKECTCSNSASMRGKENLHVEFYPDGSAMFWDWEDEL